MPSPGIDQKTIRIVLADDHTVMRKGLRRLLNDQTDFEVVGEAATTLAVLEMVRGHRPDVLVLDLHMPGGSPLAAIASVQRLAPRTRIVVLSMEHDRHTIRTAYESGVSAFVHKEAAAEQLVTAIRKADAVTRPDRAES